MNIIQRLIYSYSCFVLIFGFGFAGVALAQPRTGAIYGTVTNFHTGEPLPGANVTLVGMNLGTISDEQGNFTLDNIPVGTVSVQASFIGFTPQIKADIVISPVRAKQVDFQLQEQPIALDEIEVHPDYFFKLPDAPLSTRSQSNEEIRRLPGGFEDVIRAVSILPGVAQVQAGRNDLIIRGGAPSENLYLVEGIEVRNINHFGTPGASGGPLSYINLDFVQETTFSTGGFGVQYGDRLSSVLSLDLREGRRDRLGGKATISATQFGLNLEAPLSEKSTYLFSARRSYLDFIFKANGFSFVPEYWDFLGKIDYDLNPQSKITALGILALDDVKYFNDDADDRFENSRVMGSDQTQLVSGINWRHVFRRGFSNLTLSQTYVKYDVVQRDSLLNDVFRNNALEHEIALSGNYTVELSRQLEMAVGAQGKMVRVENDIKIPGYETYFGEFFSVDGVFDTTAFKGAVYAQLTPRIGKLRATAGIRVDYLDLLEVHPLAISPRFSATYALTPVTNLNFSVGQYRQAPAYVWLMMNPANRNLKPAGTNQFILGFDHLLRADTKISFEGYYKHYLDYATSVDRPYLVMVNTGAGFGGSDDGFAAFGFDDLVSEGTGQAYGVEVFLQKKLSEIPCYGILSLTYNRADFTALDGVERPSSFDQRWIFNVGGGYVFNEKWEFALKFRLATGRPYTPFDVDGTQSVEHYNSERLDTYHSLDLRLDRRWLFDRSVLITYLDIQNVYNHPEDNPPRWNAREQRVEVDESIGVLPSVGISWGF